MQKFKPVAAIVLMFFFVLVKREFSHNFSNAKVRWNNDSSSSYSLLAVLLRNVTIAS